MKQDSKMGRADFIARDQLNAKRYMPGLDGLRGLAVLAVVAYHLNLPWAPGGLLGVCVFFVLSGYLITDILVAQWQSFGKINLKEFWLARARRLLPALFVMLTGVIAWLFCCDPGRLASLWNDVIAAVFYISNWWFIFQQVSYFDSFGPASPWGHLWSLAIEEQFYFIWPLLLGLGLFCVRRRVYLIGLIIALTLASAAAMAMIYQPGLDPSRVYYGTDTRAFALLIGAALALVWPSRKLSADLPPRPRIILDGTGGVALLAILFMVWQSNQYQTFLYYGGLLLFSIFAAVLVGVLAHPASRLGKIFGLQPLRWLGVCSYGIYLWHYPVIILTGPELNTGGLNIALVVQQLLLSIILAAASWHLVEGPIRYGTRKKHPGKLGHEVGCFPGLPGSWGKPASVGIVSVFVVFMLVVSGSSLISQAQQSWPPQVIDETEPVFQTEEADKTRPIPQPEPVSKTELVSQEGQATQPTGIEIGESPENETQTPAGAEVTQPGADPNKVFTGKGVAAIGDSVMVEVGPELKKLFPEMVVNGKIGRQMYQAPQVIDDLKQQGVLGNTVIIQLGANGAFTKQQFADILEILGSGRQIVVINTRVPKPWESVVNQLLAQAAADAPNIKLVDWYSASYGHNEYFYEDGVHLKEAGIQAYVALLVNTVAP